jgi:spore germination protein YaaH
MAKKGLLFLVGIVVGIVLGSILFLSPLSSKEKIITDQIFHQQKNQVVGFLPFWLLGKAQKDYSKYLNTLAYFNLTIGSDGKIQKLTNPQEQDPGWFTLNSGKVDDFFNKAQGSHQTLSLVIFSGDDEVIGQIIKNPQENARNLIADVTPIMKQHNFKDLNLDIEYAKEASEEARLNMSYFIKEVKKGLDKNKLGTLTIDISASAFIKKYLINPKQVAEDVDYMVIMAYDYHYLGSYVSGPVAPIYGATDSAEFDTNSSIKEALKIVPAKKIILGVPLYGYEWETLGNFPRAATIPATGLIASNQRITTLLQNCSSCSAVLDPEARENYIILKDQTTQTFHQIFTPDKKALEEKVNFAKQNKLGGIALWALGYETKDTLEPLRSYR